MTDRCLDGCGRPQTGQYGLCDECRIERRERVRASIRNDENTTDTADDVADDRGDDVADDRREQASLTEWSG